MIDAETLRLYADILEKPYRDCGRSKEYPHGRMRPAVEINLVAGSTLHGGC